MSKESPVLERSRPGNDKLQIGAPNLIIHTMTLFACMCSAPDSLVHFFIYETINTSFMKNSCLSPYVNGCS